MPLIHSKSKKALQKNIETEMSAHPDSKDHKRNLAIAYSIKKKASKKHMAEGGDPSISAKTEKRPMPNEMHSDSDQERRNSGKKASKNDMWTDMPTVAQAQRPSKTPLSQPRMVESSVISARLRDREGNLMEKDAPKMAKGGKIDAENRAPESQMHPDLASRAKAEHEKMRKNKNGFNPSKEDNDRIREEIKRQNEELGIKGYASGGKINDYESFSAAEEDRDPSESPLDGLTDEETQPVDEYMAGHFAEGGRAGGEEDSYDDNGHEDSIAAAIMSRRNRLHDEIDSGAHDEDLAASYADGGEVELEHNAEEEPNNEDQMSFEALKKENYSESEGLDALDQPEDSNEKGDEEEKDSENKNDRISAIRSRMSKRKQR